MVVAERKHEVPCISVVEALDEGQPCRSTSCSQFSLILFEASFFHVAMDHHDPDTFPN